jgi:dephospho-CoA kinase
MLGLQKVAVTGGLSCGKSSLCRFFGKLGAFTVSADEIVHRQLSSDTTLGQHIIRLIGSEIVLNHQINRSLIAKKVFENPALLHSLEELIHPEVRRELEQLYTEVSRQQLYPLFVAEIPLLFEVGGKKWFPYDLSVAVIADPQVCQERFLAAGHSKEDYKQRIANQLSMQEKARRADFVIVNDGTLRQLYTQAKIIYNKLIQ